MKIIKLEKEDFVAKIKAILQEYKTVTFTVCGNSMRPFLEDQRDAIILARPQDSVKVGDVVLAKVDRIIINKTIKPCSPTYVIHRIVKIQGEEIILWGDGNPNVQEVGWRKDIVGITIGFYRKGKEESESVNDKKWLIYSKIWMTLSPIRRWLLAFHRRIWIKIFPPTK